MARENNDIIINGVLKSLYIKPNDKGVDMWRFNIELDDKKVYKEFEKSYEGVGDKYKPMWLKEAGGNILLKTRYDVPVKDGDTVKTLEEYQKESSFTDACIRMKIRLKEGAIYPLAMVITKEGHEVDYFADM